MSPAKREEFFRGLAAAMPEPKSELAYTTPYELLVAVVLSAQATDKSVNLATRSSFPSPTRRRRSRRSASRASRNTSAPSASTAARRRT